MYSITQHSHVSFLKVMENKKRGKKIKKKRGRERKKPREKILCITQFPGALMHPNLKDARHRGT